MDPIIIFSILILIISVVIHEVAHGYAALALGDVTAKYAGRLTLNPIKHIDPFGSIILPLLFALLPGGLILGWAKPVPYNPYNLRNQRWGELLVALAGPVSNILLALIFGILIRFSAQLGLPEPAVILSVQVVMINLLLALFNLIPVPPLDGSKILYGLLPTETMIKVRGTFDRYGLFLILIVVFFAWELLWPALQFLTRLFTGL
jgi:Zn-dependent protease